MNQSFLAQLWEALKERPVYAFVITISAVLAFGRLNLAGVWAGITAIGIIGLAVVALILVEREYDADQRYESLVARKKNAKDLLEGMADEDARVYVVYSSVMLDPAECEVIGEDRQRIHLTPTPVPRRFVAFVDAQGVGRISELLNSTGARPQIEHVNSATLSSESWGNYEVLIGGPSANKRTGLALEQFSDRIPFRFRGDSAIVLREEHLGSKEHKENEWPPERDKDPCGYGLVAKIKHGKAIILIAAGLSSHSTLACCEYLVDDIGSRGEFSGANEFVHIVSVSPRVGLPHILTRVWPEDSAGAV